MRFTELQCREVICLSNGQRMGFVSDVVIEIPSGHVSAIVVPAPCRGLGFLGRGEEYCIPWDCIRRIGPDIVLVDTDPGCCKMPRGGKGGHP